MQPCRETLALERRRLENRSREEGPGNARDGTASGAETSCIHTARARTPSHFQQRALARGDKMDRLIAKEAANLSMKPGRHRGKEELTSMPSAPLSSRWVGVGRERNST